MKVRLRRAQCYEHEERLEEALEGNNGCLYSYNARGYSGLLLSVIKVLQIQCMCVEYYCNTTLTWLTINMLISKRV